jgi:signal transduction histidine kinase
MDNHRNQSRKNLETFRSPSWLLILSGAFLCGALLIYIFLLIQPWLISSDYYQKSLGRLRDRSTHIKNEFQQILDTNQQKHKRILQKAIPQNDPELFAFLSSLNDSESKEGAAFYFSSGDLDLWAGKVIDIRPVFFSRSSGIASFSEQSTYLVSHKASHFLVSFQEVNDGYIFIYRLLAFLPEFKARYLEEYHFIPPGEVKNFDIDYWDFREDITGFERLFSRYKDEYIGQPRLQDQVQTIFFPLRNENKDIVATVTLSSPPASARISNRKEDISIFLYMFIILGLLAFLIYLYRTMSGHEKPSLTNIPAVFLVLIGLRAVFIPVSRMQKIQSLSIFSPSTAGFVSFGSLTQSPMDIFLTALIFVLSAGFAFRILSPFMRREKRSLSLITEALIWLPAVILSFSALFIFQSYLTQLVMNSAPHLLHFTLELPFFLLHLGILFAFIGILIVIEIILKFGARFSPSKLPFYIILISVTSILIFFRPFDIPWFLIALQAAVLIWTWHRAKFNRVKYKKEMIAAGILVSTMLIYVSIQIDRQQKNMSILEYSLHNTIISQDTWGAYLIEQSIPYFEERTDVIASFLRSRIPPDPAHSLWDNTIISRFNWYSSLELIGPSGRILSRFSLNIPELIFEDPPFPVSQEWMIRFQNISVLGNEKQYVVGYRDFFDNDTYLGRIRLILSIDNDMLPFLYSANPYYELLKPTSMPSLQHLDLGFAQFDQEGHILFNPNKLSEGLSAEIISDVMRSAQPIWVTLTDKGKKFRTLLFDHHQRIYALFLPKKTFIDLSVGFLKLFFLYTAIIITTLLLYYLIFLSGNIKNPFWSFSNRVYLSLIAISIIPLLIFTFSARDFFANVFTERITEEAESHARFARRVMEDFIFLQQEERTSLTIPPDNMVTWISSTISNDVNLYLNGHLASSSHREFFDYGLLPELIKGEIYYKIQFENNPFYTETQQIGEYSFHTLTVPYDFRDSVLLISLPFPLEQQEIGRFTEDLFEFLLFLTFFIIAAILILARGIGGAIINPIHKLLAGTREVGQGNLEVTIPYSHQDEMKTLIDGFNAMVKNLKKQQQELADISKKLAWAEMSRKVAHEIKNPLTPIQLSAEHLLRVYEDRREDFEKTLKESTSYIVSEVENLRKIAQEFLETSRQATVKKSPINLKGLLEDTIHPYENILPEQIQIEKKYKGNFFTIFGDAAKMKIVMRNIITNAIESIDKKGTITFDLQETRDDVKLAVSDTGKGVKPEDLKNIFEPYFSTKEGGTGLGLPIAHKIITDHGGNIQAKLNQNQGMSFVITLPKHKEQS